MTATRQLNVVLASADKNAGLSQPMEAKTVTYAGQAVEVKFGK